VTAYLFPQIKNKPHDEVATCAFVLELGVVTNNINMRNMANINRWNMISTSTNETLPIKGTVSPV
jgi:hypothetical protein